jgi:DNA replication protein DnaC
MNTETLELMRTMRLHGMHRAFKTSIESGRTEDTTPDELVSLLLQSEYDDRTNRKLERGLKNARFRYKSSIEQIDYDQKRGIDKNQLHRFADGTFITKKENILITGSTGTGKSFLSSAIGHQACLLGYKVLYTNSTRLFTQLKMAKADGTAIKEMTKIEKQDLLIIDDFGIQPFDPANRLSLLEIIEDRHGKRSTILTSQLPVKQWYDIIGEKTLADAILDRIVHDAHRIELKGESLRKKQNRGTEETLE